MPEFLPFIGTRYNPTAVDLASVVSPPFDVISPDYRDTLYDRDPHNAIRLEWNRDADPYSSAAQSFEEWKQQGILLREAHPAMYVYNQIFDVPSAGQVTRTGVIGRIRLSPYSVHEVLPHERTHAGPKRDRLALMEKTRANMSPIFGLISDASFLFDQALELAMIRPALVDIDEVLPNGETVRHILWRLDDADAQQRISRIAAGGAVIIADGHHRYETAVEFHLRHPSIPGSDYAMMFLTNMQSAGTVIQPTHRLLGDAPDFNQYRLIERLREKFETVTLNSREEGIALLEREDSAITLIEFPEDPKWVLVRDRAEASIGREDIPADRLEHEILKPIVGLTQAAIDEKRNLRYPHSETELDEMEESGPWDAAFLLRAVRPSELQSVVEKGGFMPQKTTYFYPKLLTGLVFHEFGAQPNLGVTSNG